MRSSESSRRWNVWSVNMKDEHARARAKLSKQAYGDGGAKGK